jgi:hypothetical protein
MENKVLDKENKIWAYFNKYFNENDPAGPWEEYDDQPELPYEMNEVSSSWDENGMYVIVQATTKYEKQKLTHLFDFFQKIRHKPSFLNCSKNLI